MNDKISKKAIERIREINKLSFKLNGGKEGTMSYTLDSINEHAKEIKHLFLTKKEHWIVETGDLMIHCMKMLEMSGSNINNIFDKSCERFENKINRLLKEKQ